MDASVPFYQLRRTPVDMTCPNCNAEITTRTERKSGVLAYLAGGCLCLIGCVLLFWIPCCLEDFDEITNFVQTAMLIWEK